MMCTIARCNLLSRIATKLQRSMIVFSRFAFLSKSVGLGWVGENLYITIYINIRNYTCMYFVYICHERHENNGSEVERNPG